jgi:release factor glutamine methyltransferase
MSLPDLSAAQDIATTRRVLTAQFTAAGIDTAALDARLIVGHALSLDHTALASQATRMLTAGERDAIAALAARRLNGEPVARILGVKEFWSLPFALSPATLVPRPDTETIVEAALAAIGESRKHEALRIADLGTGTGAILLALLHEWPNATGLGTDIDQSAIDTAYANARALGLASRAQFRLADFAQDLGETFDLVVSNPPYIPTRDIAALEREVRDHDPFRALDGGADGLDAYRAIARRAPHLLRADGVLIVEIGIGQAADVATILSTGTSLECAAIRPDLSGIVRALTFRGSGR